MIDRYLSICFRIRFTIVSEPLDEDDEDCSDVGSAYVSIPDILKNGADVINQEVPSMTAVSYFIRF